MRVKFALSELTTPFNVPALKLATLVPSYALLAIDAPLMVRGALVITPLVPVTLPAKA